MKEIKTMAGTLFYPPVGNVLSYLSWMPWLSQYAKSCRLNLILSVHAVSFYVLCPMFTRWHKVSSSGIMCPYSLTITQFQHSTLQGSSSLCCGVATELTYHRDRQEFAFTMRYSLRLLCTPVSLCHVVNIVSVA